MPKSLRYPTTRKTDAHDVIFRVNVADPYRWLEDEKSPEVKQWMGAQDQVARDYLAKLPGREALAKRFRELFYRETISAPVHRGGRFFYTRRHVDKEKAVVYWREGEQGEERVLLDPNTMSKDGTTSLGVWSPSWDGQTVAYALRQNNSDEATLYVQDVATGMVSETDVITGAKYAAPRWTPQGDGFYYTYLPTDPKISVDARPGYAEVRFHKLGADPTSDSRVHPKTGDPATFIGPGLSRDGRWLFIHISHGWNATDIYYRDLRSSDTTWQPFIVGKDALYEVIAWKDSFYLKTNDGAPRWRVYKAPAGVADRTQWKEIVKERRDAVIENAQVVGEHLVLTLMKNASNSLEVRALDGKFVRNVPLPGIGSCGGMTGNPDEDEAHFTFTSFTTPPRIFRTSMRGGETRLWAEVKVRIDPKPYTVEQVWYRSPGGARVSMFIIRRKDMNKDGSTPFFLTGYGGFNVNLTPDFAASYFAWLEAGGGIAIPNLRGGGEYGEEWHRAGMLLKKQNGFDDFIAAAEWLIHKKYTSSARLAIAGGSNGGLLVGAAATQRPDLFRAVICAVPLLDMVRYHLFGSGRTWMPEYGSAENEAQFAALHAYSPYHHVKAGAKYPALLMMSADSDDRVDPMHARKMTAALQAANASEHPILLRIEKNAGHGGADLIKQQVEASADSYAFLMRELGMSAGRLAQTKRRK